MLRVEHADGGTSYIIRVFACWVRIVSKNAKKSNSCKAKSDKQKWIDGVYKSVNLVLLGNEQIYSLGFDLFCLFYFDIEFIKVKKTFGSCGLKLKTCQNNVSKWPLIL